MDSFENSGVYSELELSDLCFNKISLTSVWKRDYGGESKVAISLVQQMLVVIRSKVVAMDVLNKSEFGQIIKAESKSFTTGFNINIQKKVKSQGFGPELLRRMKLSLI